MYKDTMVILAHYHPYRVIYEIMELTTTES